MALEKGPHCGSWTWEGDPGRSNSVYKGLETTVTAGGWKSDSGVWRSDGGWEGGGAEGCSFFYVVQSCRSGQQKMPSACVWKVIREGLCFQRKNLEACRGV